MIDKLLGFQNLGLTILIVVLSYIVVKKLLDRQAKGHSNRRLLTQLVLLGIFTVGFIAIILSIPMNSDLKSQITNLLGIVISAVLAMSSTTFIGNALAGIMLKLVSPFKPGDWIEVGDHFGKITEQGLFHTEIQTRNSDLLTLPNSYLTSNPTKLIRSSETIIFATVSLGYDVSRIKVEKCLINAAKSAGLENPFIYITELGDYSVVYRINGLLRNTNTFLKAKSNLYAMVLDNLHDCGIEIVSPSFMNQRQVGDQVFIPKSPISSTKTSSEINPEDIIFQKASKAESIEKRKDVIHELDSKIKALEEELNDADNDEVKKKLKSRIKNIKEGKKKLIEKIDDSIEDLEKE